MANNFSIFRLSQICGSDMLVKTRCGLVFYISTDSRIGLDPVYGQLDQIWIQRDTVHIQSVDTPNYTSGS